MLSFQVEEPLKAQFLKRGFLFGEEFLRQLIKTALAPEFGDLSLFRSSLLPF